MIKEPVYLPINWELVERTEDGFSYINRIEGKIVIISSCKELDGKNWAHFSMSCKNRVPDWKELVEAKEIFLGVESKAIQIIPPRSEYVNINPTVLHLWVCLDGDILPDFTRGGSSL